VASTIAIISDTHFPRARRELPTACVERLAAADLIVHGGDLSELCVLEDISRYGPVAAVHGNVDDAELRAQLPERLEFDVAGVRIGLVHDGGPRAGRIGRLQRDFPAAAAVIFGHSHIPLLERDPATDFQIFNPGSPSDKRRQPAFTMGWAEVRGAEISFEIIELA
jgi:putative phosphoesterase